jgi:3-phenylpropionate/trans-cinnamate dioxygenase ferredoxin subunit
MPVQDDRSRASNADRVAKHRVAKVSEITPGTTRRVVVDSVEILLCNVDGKIYAIEDVCTHDGGPLDQGELAGECVVCPRHGATFDVRTGDALTLPAVLPLMTFEVSVEGDDVFVDA